MEDDDEADHMSSCRVLETGLDDETSSNKLPVEYRVVSGVKSVISEAERLKAGVFIIEGGCGNAMGWFNKSKFALLKKSNDIAPKLSLRW